MKNKILRILMPLFYGLEKWTFKSANNLNIVSKRFLNYVEKIAPKVSISTYTNGVDEMFIKNDFLSKKNPVHSRTTSAPIFPQGRFAGSFSANTLMSWSPI